MRTEILAQSSGVGPSCSDTVTLYTQVFPPLEKSLLEIFQAVSRTTRDRAQLGLFSLNLSQLHVRLSASLIRWQSQKKTRGVNSIGCAFLPLFQ